ncbi:MAG TPA: hypothetical protein VL418_02550 [Devosiaceae bacterium]|nr:hypothetical protein [Devosiaceae bacterium]
MGMTAERAHRAPKPRKRVAARPIDMMHLAKQALGDPALELEILRMFDQRLEKHFGRLETSGSVEDLLAQLEFIRKASIGIGAWSLAQHAHVMETELKAGEPVNPERVEDIHIAVEEVRTFIGEQIALDEAANG